MNEYIIIAIVVSIIIPVVFKKGISRSQEDDKNVISISRFYFFIGAIGTPFFLIVGLAIYFLHSKDNIAELIFAEVFFAFICAVGVYLALRSRNFKLYLGETELVYTNFLGRIRVYDYSEILKITIKYNASGIDSYKIHLEKTKITVGYDMINFNSFERIITKRLKKVNNLVAIPKHKKDINR